MKKYSRIKRLAEDFDVSTRTVERRLVWIRMHSDRYPKDSIKYFGRIPYTRNDVFQDAMLNGNKVDAGIPVEFIEDE
ncbi:MAG: hypothetical protein PUE58_01765 [Lachnospiraceae bacterium]|nr:hypothetical protein [Lachnospiraceae bacterium]